MQNCKEIKNLSKDTVLGGTVSCLFTRKRARVGNVLYDKMDFDRIFFSISWILDECAMNNLFTAEVDGNMDA